MSLPKVKDLLDAGVHFGHLKRKWNPKMSPYIFMEKNGIHIIDLNKTTAKLDEACAAVKQMAKSGKKILFVSTKKQGQEIIANMGNAAPAFGMIGTLIGLVIMLKNMDDPAAIGPGMAIALLTTMYGAILANIIFGPISAKLKVYSSKEVLAKRMIIEGIMSIQSGDNPRIVEHKLSVFLSPKVRPSSEEEEREAA